MLPKDFSPLSKLHPWDISLPCPYPRVSMLSEGISPQTVLLTSRRKFSTFFCKLESVEVASVNLAMSVKIVIFVTTG